MSAPEEIEQWVGRTCGDLGLSVVDGATDFFEIGGTSLTATRLIARAEERFGVDALPPEDLYERSTIHQIAETIAKHRGDIAE
ncbi:acyl carrier protein [Nocardia panacis]|uniref:Acyl carrier protein n=1 Tax=Nocardia panacis TaxID=2340916 RepID=A0A3A4K9T9_9NOCA|nr:acyl carrier protein [Nocardia panacis]RJO69222.1 acyl carrier protein [Nocardia panacis]